MWDSRLKGFNDLLFQHEGIVFKLKRGDSVPSMEDLRVSEF